MRDYGLTGAYVQLASVELNAQQASKHQRVFVEFRVWPGSIQPPGLRMCATLTAVVAELTRPTY